MAFKTLNFYYSTKPSIIYIACCKIVLMFYNVECKISFLPFLANMNFTHCYP